jgi:CobQ-like glutamine amidotransferase family enzyme
MLTLVHLYPKQLGLNGESGNIQVLKSRLEWSGIESEIVEIAKGSAVPSDAAAVFIGSGTLAGALEALSGLDAQRDALVKLSEAEVPFLALGLGWEILGQSVTLLNAEELRGLEIYPSRSTRVPSRASLECYGQDQFGNLVTGYANHSAELELTGGAKPWIQLISGHGNSSLQAAPEQAGEGLLSGNLFATRLNGPVLAMNPHLADQFLDAVCQRLGISYQPVSELAAKADGFAKQAREELRARLAGK